MRNFYALCRLPATAMFATIDPFTLQLRPDLPISPSVDAERNGDVARNGIKERL
jgi:hypothetical protein